MIRSRKDLYEYLEADRVQLKRSGFFNPVYDEVWAFQRRMRYTEYYLNCGKGPVGWLLRKFWSYRFHRQAVRCGFDIPPNTFGPGLSIAHRGTIVVHADARIGANCRLHVGVVIGTRPGPVDRVPRIGDNCYIGPGAKIFGDIEIGANTAVGANAVVGRSFPEGDCTIAGVPARKVSDTSSAEYIIATRTT
ncbi:MAG: serine acetyltransferase [Flavobacteriales bacterium]|jgi:serine O-acetyltransferase|nr:serine acetyltransferase [Flavobacteriales bacterium]